MSFLESCRRFISIDSTSSQGTSELVAFAADLCRQAGLYVEIQSEHLNGREEKNIIARTVKDIPDVEIMLQTHLDTPDPGIHALWDKTESNPFNASIYEDDLYGLGSADSKLDFLCKLEAIKSFRDQKMKTPVVLVGTFGQQAYMEGAIKLVRKNKINAEKALVGRPTHLNLVHSASGFALVDITIPFSQEELSYHKKHDLTESGSTQSKIFYGKSASSTHPLLGENAIVKMLEYLTQLPDGIAVMDMDGGMGYNSVPDSAILEIDIVSLFKEETIAGRIKKIVTAIKSVEEEFSKFPDSDVEPPISTLNLGRVQKYKDHIRLKGCCHISTTVPPEAYESWIDRLKTSCKQAGGAFRVVEYKQPFLTNPDSEFLKGCYEDLKSVQPKAVLSKSTQRTEANVFSRLGIECLVFGPGIEAGNAHAPNEKVSIEDLKTATHFYKKIISRFCL